MSEADDEYADYLYEQEVERLMGKGLCTGCRDTMPPRPKPPFIRPIKCPRCRPDQWADFPSEVQAWNNEPF